MELMQVYLLSVCASQPLGLRHALPSVSGSREGNHSRFCLLSALVRLPLDLPLPSDADNLLLFVLLCAFISVNCLAINYISNNLCSFVVHK